MTESWFYFLMATKKSPTELLAELKSARSAARNARERLKAFKEGIKEGLALAKEARRD